MKYLLSIFLLFSFSTGSVARTDKDIHRSILRISSDSIETYIHTLVGFHTRHNLSTQSDTEKGIGAAARWINSKISNWIPLSNGRLSVENITYTAGGPGTRLERQVELTNVMAVLQGTGKQEILVLAHYDSRVNDNNDSTSLLPGQRQRKRGGLFVESIRVWPISIKRHHQILFLSGEEHGLLGAVAMAEIAEKEEWNVTAAITGDMIGNTTSSAQGIGQFRELVST